MKGYTWQRGLIALSIGFLIGSTIKGDAGKVVALSLAMLASVAYDNYRRSKNDDHNSDQP